MLCRLIKQGINDYRVFSNYGIFKRDRSTKKQNQNLKNIELNPKYSNAYYNLDVY